MILALVLISCESNKEPKQEAIVKQNVEDYLKPKMNDPASYEFVDLRLSDSVLYIDNIKFRREFFQQVIKSTEDVFKVNGKKVDIAAMYNEDVARTIENEINKINVILIKIDSLETLLGENKNNIASYTYRFSFKGTNKHGTKVMNEYILQTSPAPDFRVLNLTDDKDGVHLTPNDFPGYSAMITKLRE